MAVIAALATVMGAIVLGAAFGRRRLPENLAIIRQYRPRHLLAALLLFPVMAATAYGLFAASPVFTKNPFLWLIAKIFHDGNGAGQNNALLAGLQWKWYAVIFLPVLALAVPRFARTEERAYRNGTRNWADGAFRSLRFGLAHLIMLIPLGAALALTWAGLLYTWVYFRAGTEESTRCHAVTNTLIIAVLFAVIVAT